MSFVDRIVWQGLQKPAAPALSVSGRTTDIVTYGDLCRGIGNLSARLYALGVRPGALYGVHIPDDRLYIAMILALEYLGAATTIVVAPSQVTDLAVESVFVAGSATGWTFPTESVNPDWLEGDRSRPKGKSYRAAPDDLCHVIWTSGSTGQPKAVPLSHGVLELRAEQFDYRFGPEFGHSARLFCSMGLSSSWSYTLLNNVLARGGFFCLPGPSIDQTVAKFAAYKLQSVAASPLYLAELVQFSRRRGKEFQSLEVVVSGGGMLPAALAQQVQAMICSRLISYYGSAECGAVATGAVELLSLDQGEVGFVIPGVSAEVVDRSSRTVLSEGVGTLRIRSERAVRGYLGPSGVDEGIFGADGVYSGDQGLVSPDGLLSIFGRDSNVVNLGGPKTTLEAIETRYADAPGVAAVAAMVAADTMGVSRLVAFVVPSEGWSEPEFWQYCRMKVAPEFCPKRLVVVPSLPRVATGKVDRQKLPTLL
jgi:enterobactin synthetase component F